MKSRIDEIDESRLDDYGVGRLSVIKEIEKALQKRLQKYKSIENKSEELHNNKNENVNKRLINSYRIASTGGKIKAVNAIYNELVCKKVDHIIKKLKQ